MALGIFMTGQRTFYYLRVNRKALRLAVMSFGGRGSKGQV